MPPLSTDELLNLYDQESGVKPAPGPAPRARTREEVLEKGIITGDLARALSAQPVPRKKTTEELLHDHDIRESTGKSPTPVVAALDDETAAKAARAPRSTDDLIDEHESGQLFQ